MPQPHVVLHFDEISKSSARILAQVKLLLLRPQIPIINFIFPSKSRCFVQNHLFAAECQLLAFQGLNSMSDCWRAACVFLQVTSSPVLS